ncbi:MAG: hypothetical protein LQ342_006290 [Letrouitia transgressa]|nr:MAG: hypothetical protein LQ342_006290 [Letrouitia transgressa]
MPGDGSLQARLKLERKYESRNVDFGLYAAYDVLPLPNLHFQQYKIPVNGGDERTTIFCLKGPSDAARLVELGLYMSISTTVSQLCMPLSLCDITEVIIQPPPPLHSRYCIQELSLVERGHLKKNEKRLSWQWRRENSDIKDEWPKELPWSKTTGPFSHFSINVQGREVAQVFCLEFPIRPEDLQGKEGENSQLEVFVAGKLFGGDHVYSAKIYLSKTDMYIT